MTCFQMLFKDNLIKNVVLIYNSVNQGRRVRGSSGAVAPPRKKEKRY